MSRRPGPPRPRPARTPGGRPPTSPVPIIAATALLLLVTATVGWIIFGSVGEDDPVAPTVSPVSRTGTSATPLPIAGGQSGTPTSASSTATTTPGGGTATPRATAAPTGTSPATAAATAPAAQPTPTPVPRTTPAVGDFGELPPGDVPSGSSVPRPLELEYTLNMNVNQIPKSAPVYQLDARTWTQQEAANLAKALGITGAVQDQGGGSYRVSGGGDLYISSGLVQYIAGPASAATPDTGRLAPNDTLIQAARTWLTRHNLAASNVGSGVVVSRDESAGQALVRIKPSQPETILSAVPSATIALSGSARVVEANVRWPGAMPSSSYGLRSGAEMWEDVLRKRGFVEIPADSVPGGSGALTGQVSITGVSLAYTTAGLPGEDQYLVPLVVFTGQANLTGGSAPVPVKIYVAAVGAQTTPRG